MNEPTLSRTLLLSRNNIEEKICLLEEDQAVELYVWTRSNKPRIGDIYLGKVDNVVPGLQAVFVDIGRDKNGYLFLPEKDRCQDFKAGERLFVQVQKEETPEKGVKLTNEFFLTGKYLVYFPYTSFQKVSRKIEGEERERLFSLLENLSSEKGGFIARTAAFNLDDSTLLEEAKKLQAKWSAIEEKLETKKKPGLVHQDKSHIFFWLRDAASILFEAVHTDNRALYQEVQEHFAEIPDSQKPDIHYEKRTDLFEKYGINRAIELSLKNKCWLPSGGYILISEKPFLTTLDVNSGRFSGTKKGLQATADHINREAAVQIARQIRFRNLGGLIVIDFIDLKKKVEIETVCALLREELAKSLIPSEVIGVNDVGLMTIVRKRKHSSLKQVFLKTCPCCKGSGHYPNAFFQALAVRRVILHYYEIQNIFDFLLYIPTGFQPLFQEMTEDLTENFNISVTLKLSPALQETEFDITEHLHFETGEPL